MQEDNGNPENIQNNERQPIKDESGVVENLNNNPAQISQIPYIANETPTASSGKERDKIFLFGIVLLVISIVAALLKFIKF